MGKRTVRHYCGNPVPLDEALEYAELEDREGNLWTLYLRQAALDRKGNWWLNMKLVWMEDWPRPHKANYWLNQKAFEERYGGNSQHHTLLQDPALGVHMDDQITRVCREWTDRYCKTEPKSSQDTAAVPAPPAPKTLDDLM